MEPADDLPGQAAFRPLAKQVAAALEGAVYPLSRRELILVARANEAPRVLISMMEGLPDAVFRSLEEVQVAVEPTPAPGPVTPARRGASP